MFEIHSSNYKRNKQYVCINKTVDLLFWWVHTNQLVQLHNPIPTIKQKLFKQIYWRKKPTLLAMLGENEKKIVNHKPEAGD